MKIPWLKLNDGKDDKTTTKNLSEKVISTRRLSGKIPKILDQKILEIPQTNMMIKRSRFQSQQVPDIGQHGPN